MAVIEVEETRPISRSWSPVSLSLTQTPRMQD